ncbi:MAG TPA: fibronectin type III domain-containing protein [archaeon]|nr:fibronectin type III domain-containing protein [archaeon]
MNKNFCLSLFACFTLLWAIKARAAEEYTLKCTADAPMYGHPEEKDLNWGSSTRMRIKDYQGIPFLQFDFSALRGMRAVSCTLFVRSVSGQSAFCTDIISTIAVPWYEGTRSGSYETGASCFSRRVWPDSLWAGLGSDARSVINGDNGSLVNPDNLCFPGGGGWARVEIDTIIAQQLIDGEAYGLALFGKDIQYNRDIYSREVSGSEPYLKVTVEEGEKVPPSAVIDLTVTEASYHGRFTLSWTAPGDDSTSGVCSVYEFRCSEQEIADLEAWESAAVLTGAPKPGTAGTVQSWEISSLSPGETYYLALRARDKAWNWSGLSNRVTVSVPLDETAPAAIVDLSAVTGPGSGEVLLSWTAPGDDNLSGRAASYELRYAGQPVGSSNWEQASSFPVFLKPDTAGSAQSYTVTGLKPGETYYFAMRALDEVPLAGPVSNSPAAAASGGIFNVWAAPSYYKINPRTGNAFEYDEENYDTQGASAPYRSFNRVWDASKSQIKLLSGRNEFVACQLVIERSGGDTLKGIDISPGELNGPVAIQSENIKLYREWYHRFDGVMYPDLLVPFVTDGGRFKTHPFDIPDPQITTFGGIEQNNQTVFLEIYVPHTAPPGVYNATVTVSGQETGARELSLEVEVLDFVLPDEIHYGTEFNCYNDIGKGWKIDHNWSTATLHDSLEKVVQRSLHEHRLYLDRMPYYHNPASQAAFRCAPELSGGTGQNLTITDWTEYDRRFSPYFDGSAFKGSPRSGVPVPFYYLPFHTEWPVPMPIPKGPSVFTNQDYIAGWTGIVTEFERHINEKGWSRTAFFCYQNEKEHFGYQPWDLDEPTRPSDYEALNFFAGMFHAGLKRDGAAKMLYRCDMGHFSYMNGELDQAVDIWVINRGDYPESRVSERIAEGDIAWTYGAAPMIYQNMAENFLTHFSNWEKGARGYCYWDTFQAWDGDAWNDNHPGDTNLFYPGWAGYTNMAGHVVCPSLRMKAIRDCMEVMEGLYLMANSARYSVQESESFAGKYNSGQIESYAQAEIDLKRLLDGLTIKPEEPPAGEKTCDFSGDGAISVGDVIFFLLLARDEPGRTDLDWNGDGAYSIVDAVSLLLDILGGACPDLEKTLLAGAQGTLTSQQRFMLSGNDIKYLEEEFGKMSLPAEQLELLLAALYAESGTTASLPEKFSLKQNFPNPFNPATSITYTVPEGMRVPVRLEIFNMRGMTVRMLVDTERGPGVYSVLWDGTDEQGARLPSGVYFYRLRAGNFVMVRKMVLVK